MRGGILIVLCVLVPASVAHAIFFNDTNVIEIGDGIPPPPGTVYSSTRYYVPESNPPWLQNTNPANQGVVTEEEDPGTTTNGAENNANTSVPQTNTSQSSNVTSSVEYDIIDTLLGSGAIEGIFSGGGLLGSGNPGVGGASSFLSGGATIKIIGSRVRAALSNRLDLKEFLNFWSRGSKKGEFTDREFALMAASTAIRDANLEEVSFTASKVEIKYRSRGYLFGFIPWSFPVTVGIVPLATSLEERVAVKLPWYRWFLRKFFTVPRLREELSDVVTSALNDPKHIGVDGTVLVFEATADYLRRKVGTIQDSISREGI